VRNRETKYYYEIIVWRTIWARAPSAACSAFEG
jgi:hypothetical protein